jgi:diphthine-ammonia ligase
MNQMIPGQAGGGAAAGMHAVCSSSGGKDSLMALWEAKRRGIRLRTLLTMFDETGELSRSHAVPREIMEQQARALGLEFVGPSASWADYEPVFVRTLRELRATGHEIAVFGDIDLEPHREWEERVCASAGLQTRLPLWHRNRRELAEEALALGFRALVVCTDSRYLTDEFCGREFDARFLAELPPNVDPCGENGEFHTFVYDGPLFRRPVGVRLMTREPYVAPPELGGTRYCFARLAGV